jgi:hypothetical protein
MPNELIILIGIFLFIVIPWLVADIAALAKQKKIFKMVVDASISEARKDWTHLASGQSGNLDLEKEFLRTLQKMYIVFVAKNHDYGSSNLQMGWLPGIIIRKSDKLSRLWQLLGLRNDDTEISVNTEGVADTFLDDANYSVIGYLMVKGAIQPIPFDTYLGNTAIVEEVVKLVNELAPGEKEVVLKKLTNTP